MFFPDYKIPKRKVPALRLMAFCCLSLFSVPLLYGSEESVEFFDQSPIPMSFQFGEINPLVASDYWYLKSDDFESDSVYAEANRVIRKISSFRSNSFGIEARKNEAGKIVPPLTFTSYDRSLATISGGILGSIQSCGFNESYISIIDKNPSLPFFEYTDAVDLFGAIPDERLFRYVLSSDSVQHVALPFVGMGGCSVANFAKKIGKSLVIYNCLLDESFFEALSKNEEIEYLVLWGSTLHSSSPVSDLSRIDAPNLKRIGMFGVDKRIVRYVLTSIASNVTEISAGPLIGLPVKILEEGAVFPALQKVSVFGRAGVLPQGNAGIGAIDPKYILHQSRRLFPVGSSQKIRREIHLLPSKNEDSGD